MESTLEKEVGIGYMLDLGVLLQKSDEEYECYRGVYDKQNSYYDESQSMFEEKDFEAAILQAEQYVKNGVCNTYAVITEQPMYTEYVEDADYRKDAVVFCCYKNHDGEIVKNSMDFALQ